MMTILEPIYIDLNKITGAGNHSKQLHSFQS
jgi:hypothetical protein